MLDNTKEYNKTQVDNNLNSALANYYLKSKKAIKVKSVDDVFMESTTFNTNLFSFTCKVTGTYYLRWYQITSMTTNVRNTWWYTTGGVQTYDTPMNDYHNPSGEYYWRMTLTKGSTYDFGYWLQGQSNAISITDIGLFYNS